ncbi:MAG: discoidin domain-containing protein [Phycisphaerae bacterium]|nr:discoidin domain-containing protein [Phycisphaerae bacterium]
MNRRLLIVICLVVGGFAVAAVAATPEENFKTLFGDDVRKAALTATAKDDAELANAFLKACGMLADEPDLKVLLYQKAAEFGSKDPVGHAAAMKAVDMLVETLPKRRAEWETLRLNVRRAVYQAARGSARSDAAIAYLDQLIVVGETRNAAGQATEAIAAYRQALLLARTYRRSRVSEISAMIKLAASQVALEKRRDVLKAKVAKDPSDAALREELVMLELLEFDNPEAAAKLLKEDMDQYLRTYIPLAAGPIDKTTEASCMDLGKWYTQLLSNAATLAARTTAYKRATAYYRQFLAVHEANDIDVVRAKLALKRLDAQARKLGIGLTAAVVASKWVDLLKLIDPARHTVDGKWTVSKGALACYRSGRQLITVPATAWGGYDLKMVFTIIEDTEAAVMLPVGSGFTSLMIGGWSGRYSGLSSIDGRDASSSSNPSRVKSEYRKPLVKEGAKTTLDVSVRLKDENAEIKALLNGKKFIAWSGKQSSLSLYHPWRMKSKTFGLGTYSSEVVWHAVSLRLLDPIDLATKWVSKDATFKVSSEYGSYPPLPAFLTGEGKLHEGDSHAIHTDREVKPHVTIALKKPELLKLIVIENRRGWLGGRTMGLGVEVSLDGKRWKNIWQGDKAQPTWTVNLKTPVRARYVRIGLTGDSRTYICLAGVKIYAMK